MNRVAQLATLLVLMTASAHPAFAQAAASMCDATLVRWSVGPQGYGFMGDRCEGTYDTRVSSSALQAVSLTAAFRDYPLDAPENLVIRWPLAGADSVRLGPEVNLRAMGVDPRRIGYQMNTRVPTDSGRYDWSTAIPVANGLGKADVGMLAWTDVVVDGTHRTVHLPVAIAGSDAPAPELRLRAYAGASLTSLLVSVFRMEPDGSTVTLAADRPHPAGVWPAGDIIDVDLAAFGVQESGLYVVQLAGMTDAGAPAPIELWLYYAGAGGTQ